MALLVDNRSAPGTASIEILPSRTDSGVLRSRWRVGKVTLDPKYGITIADSPTDDSSALQWLVEGSRQITGRIRPDSDGTDGKLIFEVNPSQYLNNGRLHFNIYEVGGATLEVKMVSHTVQGAYVT